MNAKLFSFVSALALLLTLAVSTGAYAQDATPTVASTDCANNPDANEQVVRGAPVKGPNSATGVLVVIREVKFSTINVYAKCLGSNETVKPRQGFDIWSGYPSLNYAEHDACMQAVADQNVASSKGSWAFGKTVLYDGQPVPPSCGSTSDPIKSTQDKEIVTSGTVVLQVEVNFEKRTVDVRALTLDKDTATIFTEGYRLMQFVGYVDLASAQADVCPQATRDVSTAALQNGWNAGFVVTIDGGKPLSGCTTI